MTVADAGSVYGRSAAPRVFSRLRAEPIDIDRAADGWAGLAESAAVPNAFFDPAFVVPAAKALNADVTTLAIRAADGMLAGLMPVAEERLGRIDPALSAFVHDYGPLGVPAVRADCADDAIAALLDAAVERAGPARPLVLPILPTEGKLTRAVFAAAEQLERDVFIIDAHVRAASHRGADPKAELPKKRRKEYARLLRRLEDIGPVGLVAATTTADVSNALEAFLRLEASGWKGRRGTALASDPSTKAFARAAVSALAERGAASILRLRVGERDAAMLICLRHGSAVFTWKIAYDETLAHFSPGALLMLEAPRLLFADDRVELIDSCAAPDHPMIDGLWRGRRPLATFVIMPERRRWLARLGLSAHRIETRLRRTARNLRDGASSRRSSKDANHEPHRH